MLILFFVFGVIHSLLYIIYQNNLNAGHPVRASLLSFALDAYSTIATVLVVNLGMQEGIKSGLTYALGGALITFGWLNANKRRS